MILDQRKFSSRSSGETLSEKFYFAENFSLKKAEIYSDYFSYTINLFWKATSEP
jgi:hypothetical protein